MSILSSGVTLSVCGIFHCARRHRRVSAARHQQTLRISFISAPTIAPSLCLLWCISTMPSFSVNIEDEDYALTLLHLIDEYSRQTSPSALLPTFEVREKLDRNATESKASRLTLTSH